MENDVSWWYTYYASGPAIRACLNHFTAILCRQRGARVVNPMRSSWLARKPLQMQWFRKDTIG